MTMLPSTMTLAEALALGVLKGCHEVAPDLIDREVAAACPCPACGKARHPKIYRGPQGQVVAWLICGRCHNSEQY